MIHPQPLRTLPTSTRHPVSATHDPTFAFGPTELASPDRRVNMVGMSDRWWFGTCVVLAAAACGAPPEPVPPVECQTAWAEEEARAFVEALVSGTQSDRTVWPGYTLRDGSYVLDAGPSETGGACVGLWRAGRAIAFASLADAPTLLTPLYGYYFNAEWHGAPDEPMLARAVQPPSWRTWLEGLGVESAIVMPVTVSGFPIALPAFVKVQLAVHEGFHVVVQAPRWYAATGAWPEWDRQPDRAGVRACYAASEGIKSIFAAERATLVQLVNHLLDRDSARACSTGAVFMMERTNRHAMLDGVHVARHDGTLASCSEAEAIMELEEGTADYASWTVLFDLGQTTRDRLIRRYEAQQDDMYYLTGAMQLHATQLMAPDRMEEISRSIIESRSVDDGSLTATLDRTLTSYCAVPPG